MQNTQNKTGSNGFANAAAVILAILLFFRTADVLSHFAPPLLNTLVGADVSWLYAAIMAFFVEGVALAYHFDKRAQRYTPAVITKWTLLGISALCQVYDGNIIQDSVANMSDPMKLGLQWGVPLLPVFCLVLLFFVGRLPEGESATRFKGIKNYLPNPKKIWEGDEENTEFSPIEVVQTELEEMKSPNGKERETANPIKRQS